MEVSVIEMIFVLKDALEGALASAHSQNHSHRKAIVITTLTHRRHCYRQINGKSVLGAYRSLTSIASHDLDIRRFCISKEIPGVLVGSWLGERYLNWGSLLQSAFCI